MSEPYDLKWSKPAKRALTCDLPEPVAAAVIELATGPVIENPYRVGNPMNPPFAGQWSAQRSTYRILYRIDEQKRMVVVESVRHRGHAYRA